MGKIKISGSKYIVRIMELLEADDIFAYPGGAVLPIYDELAFTSMNHILVRHEQGAAFAAGGYARVKDKPCFCLATSGPGATNLVTGIADAYADSIPVIAITGQTPTSLIGSDAFQETDITGICSPVTKRTFLITNIEDAPRIFMEAYSTAINGRPGPVLIDIPKDVQNAKIEVDENWEETVKLPLTERLYNVEPDQFEKAIELMTHAKRPLVIAGHGNLLSSAWSEAREFIKRENIPAISTIMGIGVYDANDPLYFSWLGMHGMKYANDAVQKADLIIALGIRFDDRITGRLDKFAPEANVIHVDVDKSENSKNVKADAFLHADLKLFYNKFPVTLNDKNKTDRQKWVEHLQEQKGLYPIKDVDKRKFDIISACAAINEYIDEDAVITVDVGQHQMWAAQYVTKISPNRFLSSSGLGSMGFGFPAAMGAQAAYPDKEVWSITGDGGFQMNLQEMITCVCHNLPVKIVILDNAYLGMVRQWQEQFYDKNYSGVNLDNPDFIKLAEAYRIPSAFADNIDDFKTAMKQAKETQGPFLIHARVLKEENVLPMVAPGTSLSETIYYPEMPKRKAELLNVKGKKKEKEEDEKAKENNQEQKQNA